MVCGGECVGRVSGNGVWERVCREGEWEWCVGESV